MLIQIRSGKPPMVSAHARKRAASKSLDIEYVLHVIRNGLEPFTIKDYHDEKGERWAIYVDLNNRGKGNERICICIAVHNSLKDRLIVTACYPLLYRKGRYVEDWVEDHSYRKTKNDSGTSGVCLGIEGLT